MPTSNAGDPGSIPGSGRSPGEGNGNQLQYSCLENPMDGGPGRPQASQGRKELGMTERLHCGSTEVLRRKHLNPKWVILFT